MADLIKSGCEWLASGLKASASASITYTRAGVGSVSLSAIRGRSVLRVNDQYGGVRYEWSDADWIVLPGDLVIGGDQITPQAGDTVELIEGGQVLTFEVLAPAGEPVWTWASGRTMRRIHSKQIDSEAVA